MSNKATMQKRSKYHKGYYTDILKEMHSRNEASQNAKDQEGGFKREKKNYMTFWMDFDGQNLFDQCIDMSYLSDEFEDANFYLVSADSKYDAARQFVTKKFNALIKRGKRSEIQRMCLEYIFEELSEGESIQIEGKIGNIISAIENLMEAFDIDDDPDEVDEIMAFFKQKNIAELMTPEVELELYVKANVLNVGVLELKTFQE